MSGLQGRASKNFLKLFQKMETEETLPNLFYEDTVTLLPKPQKDSTKKNFRPISPKNIDIKISNTFLTNWLQEYIKTIISHDQEVFILSM